MKITKNLKYSLIISSISLLIIIACGGGDSKPISDTATQPPISKTEPTPAPTPKPTPKPTIPTTTLDSYGFNLTLDGKIDIEKAGLTEQDASLNEGIVFFEYDGANSILLWLKDSDTSIKDFLADSYSSLANSQLGITFSPINQGSSNFDTVNYEYIAFITKSESDDTQAGGIIGAWRCGIDKVFSLTATGEDGAVVQIRFKRILDGLKCSQ